MLLWFWRAPADPKARSFPLSKRSAATRKRVWLAGPSTVAKIPPLPGSDYAAAGRSPREQGWKLHFSATVVWAEEVLRQALPVLRREDASFKVAASLRTLDALNQGRWQISQIGKFITVYPNDDE
jgi:hypothetical protein